MVPACFFPCTTQRNAFCGMYKTSIITSLADRFDNNPVIIDLIYDSQSPLIKQ